MLCVPTCVLRTRGGYQWVYDGLASACGAIGVCVCEARQRDLCDCVVVIRRRCGQALTLNVVILQATSVVLPAAGREFVPGVGHNFCRRVGRRHRETRDAHSD